MARLQSQFQHVRGRFRLLTCSDTQRPDFPRTEQARTPLHTLLRAGQSPKARLRIVQLLVVPTELRKNLQTVSKDRSEVAAIGRRELIQRPEQFTTPSYSPPRPHQAARTY